MQSTYLRSELRYGSDVVDFSFLAYHLALAKTCEAFISPIPPDLASWRRFVVDTFSFWAQNAAVRHFAMQRSRRKVRAVLADVGGPFHGLDLCLGGLDTQVGQFSGDARSAFSMRGKQQARVASILERFARYSPIQNFWKASSH